MIDFMGIKKHLITGMMIHHDLAAYYEFLGFNGYKRCHEYHYIKESMMLRKLERHVMAYHHTLVKDMEFEPPEIIPSNWYNHTQIEVDEGTKKNAIKSGVAEWIRWESSFRDYLHEMMGEDLEAADRMYLECLICSVVKELKCAEKKQIYLETAGYDIKYILREQQEVHDRYKHKMKKVGRCLC